MAVVPLAWRCLLTDGGAEPASAYPTLTPNQKLSLLHIDQLSPEELRQQLQKKDFLLINTHVPYEGEIGQTDAFIPYNQIEENLAALPADKNAKIVVYCRSGRMSRIAADTLTGLGYSNVWDLEGDQRQPDTAGEARPGEKQPAVDQG